MNIWSTSWFLPVYFSGLLKGWQDSLVIMLEMWKCFSISLDSMASPEKEQSWMMPHVGSYVIVIGQT